MSKSELHTITAESSAMKGYYHSKHNCDRLILYALFLVLLILLYRYTASTQAQDESPRYEEGKEIENNTDTTNVKTFFSDPRTTIDTYRSLLSTVNASTEPIEVKINANYSTDLQLHILDHPMTSVMFQRVFFAREKCRLREEMLLANSSNLVAQLNGQPKANLTGLILHKSYLLESCLNLRSGSSSLFAYTNALRLFHLMHTCADNIDRPDIRRVVLKEVEPFSFAIVIHPFRRLHSMFLELVADPSYFKRMLPNLLKSMLIFSHTTPVQAMKMIIDKINPPPSVESIQVLLKEFKCEKGTPKNSNEEMISLDDIAKDSVPLNLTAANMVLSELTFRGTVLAVAEHILSCNEDLKCLTSMDERVQRMVNYCSPCTANYDAIVKIENLQEELLFVEEILSLPPAWELHERLLAKSNKTKNLPVGKQVKSFPDNMSELTLQEMYLLYTVYYDDFSVYQYDPCYQL